MTCQGRRSRSRFQSILFVFCLLILSACGRNQAGWSSFPVPLYVDQSILSSATARTDLEEGMQFWEQRVGQKLFDIQGSWNGQGTPYSGSVNNPDQIINTIFIGSPWPFKLDLVGVTVAKTFESGHAAMIMVNPYTHFCSGDCSFEYNKTSQRKMFAHELGHFLGLEHHQDPNNIMYPTSLPGGVISNLAVDENALRVATTPIGN